MIALVVRLTVLIIVRRVVVVKNATTFLRGTFCLLLSHNVFCKRFLVMLLHIHLTAKMIIAKDLQQSRTHTTVCQMPSNDGLVEPQKESRLLGG
jgi:hypothetical protein